MDYLTMKDGARLFYKDWGQGPAIVFSHGWPLNADEWDLQLLWLVHRGYRVISYDRRGYGRSDRHTYGDTIDTYADDLANVVEILDLNGFTLIGQGAGCGEIARYVSRHGTARIFRIILVSPMLPGWSKSILSLQHRRPEILRDGISKCREQYARQLATAYFNLDEIAEASAQGQVRLFCSAAMECSIESIYGGIAAFYETDFTDDLRAFDVPTLFIHGADDRIAPVRSTTLVAISLVRNSTKKIYPAAPHGLSLSFPEQISADIYAFLAD